jgi:hypothetical protein
LQPSKGPGELTFKSVGRRTGFTREDVERRSAQAATFEGGYLPSQTIRVVARADASGTTYHFSGYHVPSAHCASSPGHISTAMRWHARPNSCTLPDKVQASAYKEIARVTGSNGQMLGMKVLAALVK